MVHLSNIIWHFHSNIKNIQFFLSCTSKSFLFSFSSIPVATFHQLPSWRRGNILPIVDVHCRRRLKAPNFLESCRRKNRWLYLRFECKWIFPWNWRIPDISRNKNHPALVVEYFLKGRVACFVFTFSSFCLLCESDQFHEKLALDSISHDADGKQSKEHATTALREKLGQLSVSTRFNSESVDDIVLPQGSTNVMRKLSKLILLIVINLVN